jgi:hypothetical protein
MLGGITLVPLAPGMRRMPPRLVPRPGPIVPEVPNKPIARPPRNPPCIPNIGDRTKGLRADSMEVDGRTRKDNDDPPPIRPGMNPLYMPA